MQKKLNVRFDTTPDPTGYLFSLAKCLSASLRCSQYRVFADDVIAASGFAFRMWIDGVQLCPSQTSIWDFNRQKSWVENSGLQCAYTGRLWGEEPVEEARRMEALMQIRASIDAGAAAVAWDLSGCEWGIICGYDDAAASLAVLKIDGEETELAYDKLGLLEIPILSVLTVTGYVEKTPDRLVADTRALAAAHLRGEEWCENNTSGLSAYPALADFIRERLTGDTWSLQYTLGTYAALKFYAWQFFEKYEEKTLAALYQAVYTAWKAAFDLSVIPGGIDSAAREKIIGYLDLAKEAETRALAAMEE